jgi:hypothetical protein
VLQSDGNRATHHLPADPLSILGYAQSGFDNSRSLESFDSLAKFMGATLLRARQSFKEPGVVGKRPPGALRKAMAAAAPTDDSQKNTPTPR